MKYFSMFSGIGGFELGIQRAFDSRPDLRNRSEGLPEDSTNTEEPQVRADCIGYSEIDKYAIKVYERQFNGHTNYGDATTINPTELPDFDLLVGGFPCQAFSVAGKRLGFNETRGTLFFDIARILKEKQPRHLVLENVKGLLSHDSGRTFTTIIGVLTDLGYSVEWQVLNSKDFGVPQNRERVYIVGHLGNECRRKVLPITGSSQQIASVAGYISEEVWPRRHEQIRRTYNTDGAMPTIPTGQGGGVMTKIYQEPRIRRLTPLECERLQAYPDNWTKEGVEMCQGKLCAAGKVDACLGHFVEISDTQRYKMCGNAVTVNVVQAVIERLLATQVTDLASEHKTERSDRKLANKRKEAVDMNKEELKKWLEDKKFGAVILVCPRCGKVDIDPSKHLDQCDPGYEAYRQESEDNAWK